MKIITSGSKFLDIDAYGGCIAYAELLQKQGQEAQAASTAPVNASITKTVQSWGCGLVRDYLPSADDRFTLVDVSTPEFFDTFVDFERVEAVIDHHPGLEAYWRERLGDKATIEFIGAACTQVYEAWVKAGLLDTMSATSARLLLTGILDNTLNFKAKITTGRDKAAYDELAKIAGLPAEWPAQYFSECQRAIEERLAEAVKNDIKELKGDSITYPGLPDMMGQIVVWDARNLLESHQQDIAVVMEAGGSSWAVNLVSISEGVSYIMAADSQVQANIAAVLGLGSFQNGVITADRLWLRKEMLKASLKR